MLEELRIAGLGVIGDAVLPLSPGLTAVTGETGAGKTMVVTGLTLLFGARADAGRVRTGAEQAVIDGRVLLGDAPTDAAVLARVTDAGGAIDTDGDVNTDGDQKVLLIRRTVSSSGRSRAHVGGAPAPVGVLSDLAEQLLVIHGQSDQLRLTRQAEQRAALDVFAGVDLADYGEAFQQWRAAEQALLTRKSSARQLQQEADLLAHGLAEVESAAPQAGEDVALRAAAQRLGHIDALRIAAQQACVALRGDDEGASDGAGDVSALLGQTVRQLGQIEGADESLDVLAARVTDLAEQAEDLAREFAAYLDSLDADPQELARIEERRAALATLTRRYGDDIDTVLEWAEQARSRLADIDVSDAAIAALTVERDRAAKRAAKLAAALSATRAGAAEKLAAAVTEELHGLAMPHAQLVIQVRPRAAQANAPSLTVNGVPLHAGAEGVDEVEFLLQAHSGTAPTSLGRGASGGELSRVMLALEVCLADSGSTATMVFDEIDAGVGGRAAVEVGRRLAQLARTRQVVVVTHLPQVAAFADSHIVVDKHSDGAVTSSDIRTVMGESRVAELARMLGGRETDAAREHATEMISQAQRETALARPA